MNNPIKHHYLPKFYLAAFTSAADSDLIWVFDQEKAQLRPSAPKNEACVRDFYKIDRTNVEDPYIVEKLLASQESDSASAIRALIGAKRFTSASHKSHILMFVATLVARSPAMRVKLEAHFTEQVMQWAYGSHPLKDGGTAENAEFLESLSREVEQRTLVDRTWMIKSFLESIVPIYRLLRSKDWTIVTPAEGGQFITSDHPVSLHWSKEYVDGGGNTKKTPGIGQPHSEITVPLSKSLALLGQDKKDYDVMAVGNNLVAALNYRTMKQAGRFLYLPADDLIWEFRKGRVGRITELKERWKCPQATKVVKNRDQLQFDLDRREMREYLSRNSSSS